MVVQVALAEFNKLRDEIANRSTAAWTALGANITISSAVGGFVLGDKANPQLILLLPLLAPALGLLFIDHANNIGRIGDYINVNLKPILRQAAGDDRLLSYEEWVDQYEARTVARLLPFGIPLVIAFTLIPVASLGYAASRTHGSFAWGLWSAGIVVTATELVFWYRFLAPPIRQALRGK